MLNKVLSIIKGNFYNLSVFIHRKLTKNGSLIKDKTNAKKLKEEKIFLFVILIYPVSLFFLGYLYVNVSSIFLAFKTYNVDLGYFEWSGINNIKKLIYDLTADPILSQVAVRSLKSYTITLLVAFPLNIIFAFVIYKKVPFSKFFQIILFMPSILSSLVIALMFKQFVDYVVPEMLKLIGVANPPNLLFDYETAFGMQIFFVIWSGFGSQLILYSGAMSRIPDTLIDAGKIDGVTVLKEFFYITLPMVYPTITIFLVTGVAGIFTSQLALFSFYGQNAPAEIHVLGYYFFVKVIGQNPVLSEYPYAAAGGLVFTLIAAPITLLARYLLEKFGPSVEV